MAIHNERDQVLSENYSWEAPDEAEWAISFLDEDGMPDVMYSDTEDPDELVEEFNEAFPGCELLDVEMAGSRLLVSKDKLEKIQSASMKDHKAAGRVQYSVDYQDADTSKVGSKTLWAKSPAQARLFFLASLGSSAGSHSSFKGGVKSAARGAADVVKRNKSASASVRITSVKAVHKAATIAGRPGELAGRAATKAAAKAGSAASAAKEKFFSKKK